MSSSFYDRVYLIVRQVPRGRVATYGQVAGLLGRPYNARTVGWALHGLSPELATDVPWQRVINRSGRISFPRTAEGGLLQRQLLEEEGIAFDAADRVDLERFGWGGLSPAEVHALLADHGLA
jgi:methylated-DNA-protein-cysteine methyltransferase-like protein